MQAKDVWCFCRSENRHVHVHLGKCFSRRKTELSISDTSVWGIWVFQMAIDSEKFAFLCIQSSLIIPFFQSWWRQRYPAFARAQTKGLLKLSIKMLRRRGWLNLQKRNKQKQALQEKTFLWNEEWGGKVGAEKKFSDDMEMKKSVYQCLRVSSQQHRSRAAVTPLKVKEVEEELEENDGEEQGSRAEAELEEEEAVPSQASLKPKGGGGGGRGTVP